MALGLKLGGQVADALAGPSQRRLGVAASGRLHQRFEILDKVAIVLDSFLASCARPTDTPLAAPGCCELLTTQLSDTRMDGRPRQAGSSRDDADPTSPDGPGFGRSPNPSTLLVQNWTEGLELLGY
jgi:hypothetical protein